MSDQRSEGLRHEHRWCPDGHCLTCSAEKVRSGRLQDRGLAARLSNGQNEGLVSGPLIRIPASAASPDQRADEPPFGGTHAEHGPDGPLTGPWIFCDECVAEETVPGSSDGGQDG